MREIILDALYRYRARVERTPHKFMKLTRAGYIEDKEYSRVFHERELAAIDEMIEKRRG